MEKDHAMSIGGTNEIQNIRETNNWIRIKFIQLKHQQLTFLKLYFTYRFATSDKGFLFDLSEEAV